MLTDLRATDAIPLIREAYAAKRVEECSCGDYATVVFEIKGSVDPKDPLVTLCLHCNEPAVICKERVREENCRATTQSLQEGTALFNAGKSKEAFPLFCKAITCSGLLCDNIEGCTARFLRARCLMNLGRYEEAASDCSELLHLLRIEGFMVACKTSPC